MDSEVEKRLTETPLSFEERDARWGKIRREMKSRGLDCLIVYGDYSHSNQSDANVRYLIRMPLEGYVVFPREGEPTGFAFIGFLGGRYMSGKFWVDDIRTGHPYYSRTIAERVRELRVEKGSLGIVGVSGYQGERGFPFTTYTQLMKELPSAHFEDATDIIENARRIKSDAEIECMELAAEIGDQVLSSAVENGRVGVEEWRVKYGMMETMYRLGGEPGSLLLFCAGKEILHAGQGGYVAPASLRHLEAGDVILTEHSASYSGYIAHYNQPFRVGDPGKEWMDLFNVALEAYQNGFKSIRAGLTVEELDEAFLTPIKEAGYTYLTPPFHGIGLDLEEPIGSFPAQPMKEMTSSLELKENMTIGLEPQVVSKDLKKGIHLGDTIIVTDAGCRHVSKSWKPEFCALGR